MVMPSVVISSSPLVRYSVPPESAGANVIVSLPGLALASPRASRNERPPPSAVSCASVPPSNV